MLERKKLPVGIENFAKIRKENYWSNTSGNEVLYHFIDSMGEEKKLTKMELERLVNGGIAQKEIS